MQLSNNSPRKKQRKKKREREKGSQRKRGRKGGEKEKEKEREKAGKEGGKEEGRKKRKEGSLWHVGTEKGIKERKLPWKVSKCCALEFSGWDRIGYMATLVCYVVSRVKGKFLKTIHTGQS